MTNTTAFIEAVSRGVEITGIAVMIIGGLIASGVFLSRWRSSRVPRTPDFEKLFRDLRANLGRAILLGLEFLVAADIIGTVAIDPNFRNLGVLALIVAIRTFLSFSLEVEISGRWPWQESVSARDT
ncbi:MAG TPA: DUF1622 domain-containing protein [Gemmatimonadaceae bacterium]|nr:DUF1622 domain-containing protein [Gemmatimonadaceae bacterium]